jgi:single-strand DNA-binding protein
MAGINKVILIGNLGKDPEVRHLENGAVVANVTLATTETYKDRSGNKVENTEWHDLEMWDGLAKIAEQYLKKGRSVYVEGKIKSDTWQDEQGNNRKRTKIRVVNLTMLGNPNDNSGGGSSAGSSSSSSAPIQQSQSEPVSVSHDQETDDLPF